VDVTAVMAADAQMDPDDLETLAGAVARGEVDYAKANRLFTGQAWEVIPRYRYLGNAVLSLSRRSPPATGTWPTRSPVTPRSRCGTSTCSTSTGLQALRLPERPARAPERLGRARSRLPVAADLRRRRALGIRLRKVVPTISWLLLKGFFWRMREKYVIRDFHPLVFFYFLGLLATILGLGLGIAELILRILGNDITPRRSCSSRCC
jgi:hypothetical protein